MQQRKELLPLQCVPSILDFSKTLCIVILTTDSTSYILNKYVHSHNDTGATFVYRASLMQDTSLVVF